MPPRKLPKKQSVVKLEVPDTFLTVPEWASGTYVEQVDRPFALVFSQHLAWLKNKKTEKMTIAGEKPSKARRKPQPLEILAEKYPPNIVAQQQEINEKAKTPRKQSSTTKKSNNTAKHNSALNDVPNPDSALKTNAKEKPTISGSTRRALLRNSEIKSEALSPAVSIPQPAAVSKPVPKSVARVKEEQTQLPLRSRGPSPATTATNTPRRAVKTAAVDKTNTQTTADDKYSKALERKQLQAQQKQEKLRRENEEKKKRVEAKRIQQEEEERRKRAEMVKKQEQADEVRRINAHSPARSRVASTMNTPTRAVPNSVRTPGIMAARARLFNSPARTPGRAPAKTAKLEQGSSATAVNTTVNSPREVKRKGVRAAAIQEEFNDVHKTKNTVEKPSYGRIDDDFKAAQMRLLMGSHDADQEHRESENREKERLRQNEKEFNLKAEQERQEQEYRRQEEEKRRLQEENIRMEKEILKRKQKEEEELRRLEEQRARAKLEEEERIRAKLEEEERLRAERERLLHERDDHMDAENDDEDDDEEQEELCQKMNESSLIDKNTSSYDMTMEKVFLPSTADNYNIEDLESGDETDDETAPRKKVPAWADWNQLIRLGLTQAKIKYDFEDMYGVMGNPHDLPIFNTSKKPRRARGSSAQWNSPVTNPTKGKSRFLGV